MPSGALTIGGYSFSSSKIESAVVSDGVTDLPSGIFCNCDKLKSIVLPVSIRNIGEQAFFGATSLATVFYRGTAEEYKAIKIEKDNGSLKTATKYFYQDEKPARRGKYWHYICGVPTLW
jgi:hypothetical protein